MKRARRIGGASAVCFVVAGLARLLVACGDGAATQETPAPDSAVEAATLPEAAPPDASAPDAQKPRSLCSTDGWCHTALPGADAGGLGEIDPNVPPFFDLRDVWVAPDHRVFAVSSNGFVLRWSDGAGWTVATKATQGLTKVWGTSSKDIWVGGGGGLVLHGTGEPLVFVDASVPGPGTTVTAIGGTSATDVWVATLVAFFHREGAAWTAVAPLGPDPRLSFTSITGMWGKGPNDFWAAGAYSYYATDNDDSPTVEDLLLRWVPNGASGSWERIAVDATGFVSHVSHFVVGSATTTSYPVLGYSAIGDGRATTLRRGAPPTEAGASLAFVDVPTGLTYGTTEGIWASTTSDVWMVGSPGVLRHFDGKAWRLVRASITPGALFSPLHAVSGVVTDAKSDVWIVGENVALHRDERTLPSPGGP